MVSGSKVRNPNTKNVNAYASGTILANLLIMNSGMSALCSNPVAIKKPDREKNRLMPIAPAVEFNCSSFGPNGSI